MPVIMNALDEEQQISVGGTYFHFAPRQLKFFSNENIARTLVKNNKELGFMSMPDEMSHLAMAKPENFDKIISSDEKALIEEKRKEGVENYCSHLRALVYNAQVSMRKDLDTANIKTDPRSVASKGDLRNLEQLVKYQAKKEDADQKRIDRFKELEKKLEGK